MPVKKTTNKEGETAAKKPAVKKAVKEVLSKKQYKEVKLLRGFRDILPEDQPYWDTVRDKARCLAEHYSFGRIELPILEAEELFNRSVGKATDIIEKEMYCFTDPSESKVALRPEATASAVRAYVGHGMIDRTQPVKLFYMGPMFRHDRPQAGRYRQFHQFGFESIGEGDAIVDAQLIVIASRFFKDLGLDVVVEVNSIGTPDVRKEYVVELASYFRQFRKQFSEDDKRRLQKNPLRLLDSKEEYMKELLQDAPQIVDWLDDASKNHFMKVLEYLEEVEVPYRLNSNLVRGLDYYNRTVFEIFLTEDGGERHQNALASGGRYDGLVEMLGGREDTPACGFAVGMERVVQAMKEKEIEPSFRFEPKVFFAQLGEAARRKGLRLFEDFRAENIPVVEAFGKGALKAQLEMANKMNAFYTLILGQKEVLDGTIIIRDMESGAQEIVDAEKIVGIVKKRLENID
ncbi:MAG: histidine--tRNA ligase [bacterium]|nr:histidine--tRNA ligase [bacterium]